MTENNVEVSKNNTQQAYLAEKFKNFRGLGLTGLANMGNTCFMNSVLQCLSHTYELNIFLNEREKNNRPKLNNVNDSLLLCEWDNLRKLMWSENCTISPGGFLSAVQKVARIKDRIIFTGYNQNDVPEFLQFLSECFHNSICRGVEMVVSGTAVSNTDRLAETCYKMMKNMYEKEYSEFLRMFFGIHVSQIKSKESNYVNITPEPFFNLSLSIENQKTLEDCLDFYTKEEILDGDNKIFNEKENKKEIAERGIMFWSLPDILIITLKRFGNNIRKKQHMVDFPIVNLDMSKYVLGYDKSSYIYDCYGVCNHSGGVGGGHYTASVKNANGKWYHFNDTSVNHIDNLAKIKTPRAYCFFYRKQKK